VDEPLDIHAPEFARDPFEHYRRLREQCPIFSDERYGGFTLLTRYDDVRAAAIDWRTYTSSVAGVTAIPVITHRDKPQLPIELDPPLHSAYRAIVNPLFAAKRLAELRPAIETLSQTLIAATLEKDVAEFVADFADPFSVGTLGILTGLPTGDAALWHEWLRWMFSPRDPAAARAATAAFGEYIDQLIRRRQQTPADDVVSMLLAARVAEKLLSFEEIHSYMTVIFGAGFETTADAMSGTAFWLSEEPGRLAAIRGLGGDTGAAVEEFLRFVTPIQMFGRNTTRDTAR
jgi:cytochrome P450